MTNSYLIRSRSAWGKAVLLWLCAICLMNVATAQPVTIEGVSWRSFAGVQSMDGQFFYTFYFGEKSEEKGMANFVLQLYDQDLKSIATKNIQISKRSELAASAFSGKYFLFVFADMNKKTMTKIILDKSGNVVKQVVDEDVKRTLLTEENYPTLYAANEDEFLVVRPQKEDKFGYVVERLDKDLNMKWTKSFIPEKGRYDIVDTRCENGKLFVLRSDQPYGVSNQYFYKVQCVNANTGDELYCTELVKDNDGGFPNFINVGADGSVATGGMYFEGSKYDDKNSDGFFFTLLTPDGKIGAFTKTTWKSVKDQIKGEYSEALTGGKTKPMMEDIIRKPDGSFTLIGETFRKSNAEMTGGGILRNGAGGLGKGLMSGGVTKDASGNDQSGFTVMDFIFINFDAKGNFTGIEKVDKTTREAVIKGSMASEHGLAIAQWLYDTKKFFCYRYTIDVNGKQYIVYKNEDGFKTKAYFLPVGSTTTDGIGSIDLDRWLSDNTNKLGKFTKFTDGNKKTFQSTTGLGERDNYEIYKNLIPAKPGYMLMYQLNNNGNLDLWLEPVPVK